MDKKTADNLVSLVCKMRNIAWGGIDEAAVVAIADMEATKKDILAILAPYQKDELEDGSRTDGTFCWQDCPHLNGDINLCILYKERLHFNTVSNDLLSSEKCRAHYYKKM